MAEIGAATHRFDRRLREPVAEVRAITCSTSPVQVPQDAEAFVCALTSASVLNPLSAMVWTILPLQTPLQPQISASSGKAATAAVGSRGAPPT
jgi:hypothetical protein